MISSTEQFKIRQKSSIFIVLIPFPFFILSIVALLILCFVIRVYVEIFNFFKVFQKGA